MNCKKCGAVNLDGSKFCVGCGADLREKSKVNSSNVENSNNTNFNINTNSSMSPNNNVNINTATNLTSDNLGQTATNVNKQNVKKDKNVNGPTLNFLMYIVLILVKPFKCFKEEEEKLSYLKNSLILSAIVAGAMTILNLITAMITTVIYKEYSLFSSGYKTTIKFSRLSNLHYGELIFKNLLIYAVIIAAIALVYYLAALVFKKQVNFVKLLAVAASSLIPIVATSMIVSPILGLLWEPLAVIVSALGVIYSVLILINLMDYEISFEETDLRIYYHLICMGVLVITGIFSLSEFFEFMSILS